MPYDKYADAYARLHGKRCTDVPSLGDSQCVALSFCVRYFECQRLQFDAFVASSLINYNGCGGDGSAA
jgi:hypothetical protein